MWSDRLCTMLLSSMLSVISFGLLTFDFYPAAGCRWEMKARETWVINCPRDSTQAVHHASRTLDGKAITTLNGQRLSVGKVCSQANFARVFSIRVGPGFGLDSTTYLDANVRRNTWHFLPSFLEASPPPTSWKRSLTCRCYLFVLRSTEYWSLALMRIGVDHAYFIWNAGFAPTMAHLPVAFSLRLKVLLVQMVLYTIFERRMKRRQGTLTTKKLNPTSYRLFILLFDCVLSLDLLSGLFFFKGCKLRLCWSISSDTEDKIDTTLRRATLASTSSSILFGMSTNSTLSAEALRFTGRGRGAMSLAISWSEEDQRDARYACDNWPMLRYLNMNVTT